MGHVVIGTVLGSLIGLGIASLPQYDDARFSVPTAQGGTTEIRLSSTLRSLSRLIGVAAGAIVGAIAGATAARPNNRPIPVWFWITLIVLAGLLVLAGLVGTLLYNSPSPADPQHEQNNDPAINKQGPNGAANPPAKNPIPGRVP